MRDIRRIVIHCTGTGSGVPREAIEAHFKRMGWRVGGYHFLIDWSGTVYNPVPVEEVANGARGFNADSIHVAYIGGLDDRGLPRDTRNEAQRDSLRNVVGMLRERFADAQVVGHRDLSPDLNHDGVIDSWEWTKHCPCFDVKGEL